jgi:hypothetical protein
VKETPSRSTRPQKGNAPPDAQRWGAVKTRGWEKRE